MIRRLAIFVSGVGGVLAAIRVVELLAKQADPTAQVDLFSGESALFAIPICVAGSLVGAFLGGILFPAAR